MSLRYKLKTSRHWFKYKGQRNYVNNLNENKKKRNHIESRVNNSTNTNTKPIWDALNIPKPKSKEDLSCDTLNNHFVSITKILTSHLKRPARDVKKFLPTYCHVSLKLHIWI